MIVFNLNPEYFKKALGIKMLVKSVIFYIWALDSFIHQRKLLIFYLIQNNYLVYLVG